jgi:hypothetical protein
MAEDQVFFRNQTIKIYATLEDEDGYSVPLRSVQHFQTTVKRPYKNKLANILNEGITGPIIRYINTDGESGPSRYWFTYDATDHGTHSYRVQYNSNTGPSPVTSSHIKTATNGTFRVVDDKF